MSGFWNAAIPGRQVEVDASSANYTCPRNTVAIRINDNTSDSVSLVAQGDTDAQQVTHDNLANGEVLVGKWKKILAAGTTCTSVVVFYMDQ